MQPSADIPHRNHPCFAVIAALVFPFRGGFKIETYRLRERDAAFAYISDIFCIIIFEFHLNYSSYFYCLCQTLKSPYYFGKNLLGTPYEIP